MVVAVGVSVGPGVSVGLNVHVGRGDTVGVEVSVGVGDGVGVSVSGGGVVVGRPEEAEREKKDIDRINIKIRDTPNKASIGISDSLLDGS